LVKKIKKMWKILRQANQKCLAPKDNPQKLKKLISSGVLEFMVSNTTGNSQWENSILQDFNFRGLIEP
jgi:hypothetical protein